MPNLDDKPCLPPVVVGGLAVDNYRGRIVRVDEDKGRGYHCDMLACSTLADWGQNLDPPVYVTEDYYLFPLVFPEDKVDERFNVSCITCGGEMQESSNGSNVSLLHGVCEKCGEKYKFKEWGVVQRPAKRGD